MYELDDPNRYYLVKSVVVYPNLEMGRVERVSWKREGRIYGETVWLHLGGGRHITKGGEDEVLEVVDLSPHEDPQFALDWTSTTAYKNLVAELADPTLRDGWVTPEGRFLRCSYGHHDMLARLVLKGRVRDIEKTHVRISAGKVVVWSAEQWHRLTDAQREFVNQWKERG